MAFLQAPRDRAGLLILVLALGIAIAVSPFASGLFGAAVLYVIFVGLYRRLARAMRPGFAASITLVAALLLIALPLAWVIGMLIAQAPDALQGLQDSALLARVSELRIGTYDVGAELARASGTIVSWLSTRAFGFVGSATSATLNLVISFFGLYYMLRSGDQTWFALRGYIPFSSETADALRDRFVSVTQATLLGTFVIALIQGGLVGPVFLGNHHRVRLDPSRPRQRYRVATGDARSHSPGALRRGGHDAGDRRGDREQRRQSDPTVRVSPRLAHSSNDHARRRFRRREVLRVSGAVARTAGHRVPVRATPILPNRVRPEAA